MTKLLIGLMLVGLFATSAAYADTTLGQPDLKADYVRLETKADTAATFLTLSGEDQDQQTYAAQAVKGNGLRSLRMMRRANAIRFY